MAVLNITAPILEGKFDAWKEFHDSLKPGGENHENWKNQMQRTGITRQVVSLQRTPMGDFVNVFFEGDDPAALMKTVGSSDNEFDKKFAAWVMEVHGIDVSEPPPGPMSEVVLDYTA